jgi:hypothetical protein
MLLQKLKFIAYILSDAALLLLTLITMLGLMEVSFNVIEFDKQALRGVAAFTIISATLSGYIYLMFELRFLFGYKHFPVNFKDALKASN